MMRLARPTDAAGSGRTPSMDIHSLSAERASSLVTRENLPLQAVMASNTPPAWEYGGFLLVSTSA